VTRNADRDRAAHQGERHRDHQFIEREMRPQLLPAVRIGHGQPGTEPGQRQRGRRETGGDLR
jgi:hypothetical protein